MNAPDERPKKEAKHKALLGFLKHKDEREVRMVTVRQEKKVLRRVVKPKPRARKHMADALKAPTVTNRDLEITERIIDHVAPSPIPTTKKTSGEDAFTCVQCGSQVPPRSERCPKCGVRYLFDVDPDVLDKLSAAEEFAEMYMSDFVGSDGVPCIHFDAETGMINYLEEDDGDPDFELECSHCGTVIQFGTDRCPICGTKLELGDTGLVSLFADMEFDEDSAAEEDCPSCGEHVVLQGGRCPLCDEPVQERDLEAAEGKVRPVVRGDNVVFLHLNVESGELNYLQRMAHRQSYEQMSIQLEGIGRGGFDEDWRGLSRI